MKEAKTFVMMPILLASLVMVTMVMVPTVMALKKSSIGGNKYLDYLWEPCWLLVYI
jgi:hypothetical protein